MEHTRRAGLAPDPEAAVVVVDAGGRITGADERAEALLGWPAAELVGCGVGVLVDDRGTEPGPVPVGADLVLTARRRDGGAFPARVSLAPAPPGAPEHAVQVTIAGLTGRTASGAWPRVADTAGLREVAHDLNNVLSVMLVYSELIERAAEGCSTHEYLAEVRAAAERGARLTDRLRVMALKTGGPAGGGHAVHRPRIDQELLLQAIRRHAAAGAHREQVGVVVVDDHRMFADGLVRLLDLEDGIDVLGVGGTGHEAVELVERFRPRVLLLDVDMPGGSGLGAAAEVKRRWPSTMVVIVTGSHDDALLLRAIDAGCSGYLTKDRAAAEVTGAVRAVAAGEALVSADQMERLLPRLSPQARGVGGDLTDHERAVLDLLARGATTPSIAAELLVSLDTARDDVAGVLTKLHAHSTLEAVATAIREGVTHYNSPFE